jgi:hypothetical protein
MFLKSFLHSHPFRNLILHPIIGSNKTGQHLNELGNFALRNDNYAVYGITEY